MRIKSFGKRNALTVAESEKVATMLRNPQLSAALRGVLLVSLPIPESLTATRPLLAQGVWQGQSITPTTSISISTPSVLGTESPYLGSAPARKATLARVLPDPAEACVTVHK